MIKQYIIDEMRTKMDIHEVISHFIAVKKDTACCPFHNEKTPSFHITKAKQIFKCFGCGEGGDAITFVMKHEHLSFIEAVEWLCNFYNIAVEYDQVAKAETEEKKNIKAEMLKLLSWSQKKFEDLLHSLPADAAVIRYLQQRGYNIERIRNWSLGFAPDDWKFLTTPIINMGKHNIATDLGIISTSNGKNYDFYRNRITIPIHDHNGVLIGFGGRYLPTGDKAADEKIAKYFNPKESIIYSKAKVWYGLNLAIKAIKDAEFAYVVEGYMDVQAMHDAEINNTVASCGTEIDEQQVKLLKRYTDHVVICYDGDEPGVKKQMKQIDLFLKNDFKVSIIEIPDAMDPDEYINDLQLTNAEVITEGAFCD